MTTKKKPSGLGRGLGSILPDVDIDAAMGHANLTTAISTIPIDQIEANPFQPRKEFDQQALDELAQSIRQQGVITPITVRQMPDGKYQLIAGERRLRASQLAGLTELPAYIRIATDTQMMEMALVENIQRENLNAMEIAFSYNALIEECNLTHEQLSEKVGKNRSTITNYLRLLNLPSETQLALSNEQISMAPAVHKREDLPEVHAAGRSMLKQYLQSEVDIKRSRRGKGTLTIHFNNDRDFERIIQIIRGK